MNVYTAGSPRFIASALSSTVGVILPRTAVYSSSSIILIINNADKIQCTNMNGTGFSRKIL